MESRMIWDYVPPPQVRIPGLGGASVMFRAAVSPEAMAERLGVRGVDIELMTPTYRGTHGRRPVSEDFAGRLVRFLWAAASDPNPEMTVATFSDAHAGLSIEVLESDAFLITLNVEVMTDETDGTDDVDALNFETSRVSLITAAEQAEALVGDPTPSDELALPEPVLPLDLLQVSGSERLTGIYRTGRGVGGTEDMVAVFHYVSFNELAHAEVETSFLTAHLPFCVVAAQGVDAHRIPWAIVVQILPLEAHVTLGGPWRAVETARQELHHAMWRVGDVMVLAESVTTRADLVRLLHERGIRRHEISDWSVEDLALMGISELANAPLQAIATGRLTGCASPEIDHDCPRDVFNCVFGRWQERLFLEDLEGGAQV